MDAKMTTEAQRAQQIEELDRLRDSGFPKATTVIRAIMAHQRGAGSMGWGQELLAALSEDAALLAGADALRLKAERASPSGLAAYRPQHHDGCDSFHCIRCGGRFGGDLRYTCRCIERRQPKPCSCGLDALLKSAEGKDGQ